MLQPAPTARFCSCDRYQNSTPISTNRSQTRESRKYEVESRKGRCDFSVSFSTSYFLLSTLLLRLRIAVSASEPQNTTATIVYPAKSCHSVTAAMLRVAAIQTRKNARAKLATIAIASAPRISKTRFATESRFSSPKSSAIMSEVCNERTPLHASFTPTRPLLTRMRLPSSCAGIPQRLSASVAVAATVRMRPCTMGCSIGEIHGTATKKNKTGKLKCFTHAHPPAR